MESVRVRDIPTRMTVLLTVAVAFLSVATGVVNIEQTGSFGPLGAFIPGPIQHLASFSGAATGFLMVASALGMRRGLKFAWYSTVLLLPLTTLQGLIQASPYSVPLVLLSIVTFPVVLLHRSRFDRPLSLSSVQIAAGLALAGVQVYGTIGAWALREEFTNLETLLDAFYFALVTASTVGYGDITPTSQEARLFGMSVLVLGTASFAIAVGVLLGPAIEGRFVKALGHMTTSELETLENHVIVAGYGDLTEPIISELEANNIDFVVLSSNVAAVEHHREPDRNVVSGDPGDESALKRVGIDRAAAVVASTNDDGEDALSILTVRQISPEIRIVASATERENEAKLRNAGADAVISPAVIGGQLLVRSAMGNEDAETIIGELLES